MRPGLHLLSSPPHLLATSRVLSHTLRWLLCRVSSCAFNCFRNYSLSYCSFHLGNSFPNLCSLTLFIICKAHLVSEELMTKYVSASASRVKPTGTADQKGDENDLDFDSLMDLSANSTWCHLPKCRSAYGFISMARKFPSNLYGKGVRS